MDKELKRDKTETTTSRKSGKKRPYQRPELICFGSVTDLTRSITTGGLGDGGTAPSDRKGTGQCLGLISNLNHHRNLLLDSRTQDIFHKAIMANVKPGDVVLDMGTGTGIHAVWAAKAGAKKVYAVDASPVIATAEEVAEQNGVADRIEFVYGKFRDVELPEKVDVIIANLGFQGAIDEMPFAAERWLKPEGIMLPTEVEVGFAPVECERLHEELVNYWGEKPYGLDVSPLRKYATNLTHYNYMDEDELIAEGHTIPVFNLREEASMRKEHLEFTARRDGTVHGLIAWYSFRMPGGDEFSTRPPIKVSPDIWIQTYLPIDEPLQVNKGDKITSDIGMYWKGSISGPVWRWTIDTETEHRMQHSFNAIPLRREFLTKLSANHQ